MDDTITHTNASVVSSFSKLELALQVRVLPSPFVDTRQQAKLLQTGKEYEELYFRRGSPLACRVMRIRALVGFNYMGMTIVRL